MRNLYPSAANDLGLGEGDLLANEVDQNEDEKKKRLNRMAAGTDGMGPNMGMAAQMLGLFRG